MYGMVNECIRDLVVSNHGEEMWHQVCQSAKAGQTEFERMTSYDDGITYSLVGAVCDHTGLTADEVLRSFGVHFIKFAGNSNFGNLMRMSGKTLLARLEALDDMHDHIKLTMPHLRPPSFEVEPIEGGRYRLRYYSEREALAPMVIGLVYGLADDTGETVEISHVEAKSETLDHDVFEVRIAA